MPRTKVSTAITVNLALVDDNNAPITAWTFVAGDVKILAPGTTAWANPAATPVQTTGGNSRGDWQITLTGTEVGATPGELEVLVYKAGAIAMRRRTIDVEAAGPGELLAGAITSGTFAANAITAAAINTAALTNAKFATGAIDANAIADGAIDAGAIADGSIIASKIGGNAITSAKIAAGALTANAFADDSITGPAVATTAVAKLQAGLATASAVQSVQDDTNDLQARTPAALVGGRTDAYVGAMGANVVTSSALDATAATEIATAVGAPSAATISTQVATDLATAHGAGSWEGASSGGATASEIADAVWADATGVAVAARVAALLPSYFLDDTVARNVAGLPTSARRRFYASAAHLAAATAGGSLTGNEVATVTMTWTYSADMLTAQRGAA